MDLGRASASEAHPSDTGQPQQSTCRATRRDGPGELKLSSQHLAKGSKPGQRAVVEVQCQVAGCALVTVGANHAS